ncbi:MAG: DUF5615 family PIN-like protein [Armatimonadetes bacterium]|nr:DUF5615 family PIN-like protein [Armatimonadota bacterium]CUU34901.1 Predicted nuclease, contains PIN domain, potential toxin-antitoxin system component [Armatimonadetes bacterium DC]
MRFKIDENLPIELAQQLRAAGYDAETVAGEGLAGKPDEVIFEVCQQEGRILLTLDRGFGDIRRYGTRSHAGILVLCPVKQDRETVYRLVGQVLQMLGEQPVENALWIVEEGRVRIRVSYNRL